MSISGEKLRLLRLAARMPQKEFAEQILGIPQPNLSAMEGGIRPVPLAIAQKMSFLTGFALSFLDSPVEENVPVGSFLWYRKQRNKYRKGEGSQAYCQIVFDTFEPLTKELKPRIPRLSSLVDCTAKEAASHVRNSLGIRPGAPIENITIQAEAAGVRVVGLPNPMLRLSGIADGIEPEEMDEDFDAFSFWTPSKLPVIFVKSDLDKALYNWAIGHELNHLVLHSQFHGDIRVAESEAQAATEELFMPEASFRDTFPPDRASIRYLEGMAQYWNVSYQSIVLRAFNLNLLNERNKRYYHGCIKNGAGANVALRAQKPRFYRQMAEKLFGTPINIAEIARKTRASKDFLFDVLQAHSGLSENLPELDLKSEEVSL